MANILVIDNDLGTFETGLRQALSAHTLHLACSGRAGLDLLRQETAIDLVLLDIMMPPDFAEVDAREGVEVLKEIKKIRPEVPVVMLTVLTGIDLIVETIQEGAFHYILKPFERDKLRDVVRQATENVQLKQQLGSMTRARDALLKVHSGKGRARSEFQGMIGAHPLMQRLYDQIERVAQFDDVSILILGETGSGKDLAAQAIHKCSARRDGPFVAINCAGQAETMLEAELFGFRKGAFTGADHDHDGFFVQANRGTLFLDEIGDMSSAMQSKLLRAIENKEITPIGGKTLRVNVRVISATHRDLGAAKESGDFREDLYYRISDVPLTVPALRERKEDIPLLARHLCARYSEKNNFPCAIEDGALKALTQSDWPGNVRQLDRAIRRLMVDARDGVITDLQVRDVLGIPDRASADHEPDSVQEEARPSSPYEPAPPEAATVNGEEDFPEITDLSEYARIHGQEKLKEVLTRAIRGGGNARGAMVLLGMPEARYDAFRKWLQRLDISVRNLRE